MNKFENILLKGAIGILAGGVIASVVMTIKFDDTTYLLDAHHFFLYAALMGIILSKNKKIEKHIIGGGALAMLLKRLLDDLERYRKQYGPLPEEQEKQDGKNHQRQDLK